MAKRLISLKSLITLFFINTLAMLLLFSSFSCGSSDSESKSKDEVDESNNEKNIPTDNLNISLTEVFYNTYDNLMANYWDENPELIYEGNITGDTMHDGPTFFSAFAHEYGHEIGDQDLLDKADTVTENIKEVLKYAEINFLMYSLFKKPDDYSEYFYAGYAGMPALVQSFIYSKDPEIEKIIENLLSLSSNIIAGNPKAFEQFELNSIFSGCVTLGAMAMMNFMMYNETNKEIYLELGELVLNKAEEYIVTVPSEYGSGIVYVDPDSNNSISFENLWILPQGSMLLGLISAYDATSSDLYLDKALKLVDGIDSILLNDNLKSYYDELNKNDSYYLSPNNLLTTAFLNLYEATNDQKYLNRAGELLDFIKNYLYDQEDRISLHHYTANYGTVDYFCTGCSFHLLWNIIRYYEFTGKEI